MSSADKQLNILYASILLKLSEVAYCRVVLPGSIASIAYKVIHRQNDFDIARGVHKSKQNLPNRSARVVAGRLLAMFGVCVICIV